ncbi:hypothetical protein BDQ17DRAFT_1355435 [Cyathus striatus]|nr:hypothetical protein BDQ17DRAFT_1355435 [Cyathus striatus]
MGCFVWNLSPNERLPYFFVCVLFVIIDQHLCFSHLIQPSDVTVLDFPERETAYTLGLFHIFLVILPTFWLK